MKSREHIYKLAFAEILTTNILSGLVFKLFQLSQ